MAATVEHNGETICLQYFTCSAVEWNVCGTRAELRGTMEHGKVIEDRFRGSASGFVPLSARSVESFEPQLYSKHR